MFKKLFKRWISKGRKAIGIIKNVKSFTLNVHYLCIEIKSITNDKHVIHRINSIIDQVDTIKKDIEEIL